MVRLMGDGGASRAPRWHLVASVISATWLVVLASALLSGFLTRSIMWGMATALLVCAVLMVASIFTLAASVLVTWSPSWLSSPRR